jgi:hypothetical protein
LRDAAPFALSDKTLTGSKPRPKDLVLCSFRASFRGSFRSSHYGSFYGSHYGSFYGSHRLIAKSPQSRLPPGIAAIVFR